MSTISTVCCRRASRSLAAQITPSSSAWTQTRGYAAPKKSAPAKKITSPGFKGKRPDGGERTPMKREKKLSAFQPMPAGQLMQPIFEGNRVDQLQQLQTFHPEVLTDAMEGQALKFPHNDKDPFRIFGLPRKMLVEFRLLSTPCSVIRGVTIDVVNKVDAANNLPSSETRLVFTGTPGCGKSFLLLQALQYCLSSDWLVFYIPRAINLVNSTTTYAYDMRTQTYLQPVFAFQTLQRFLTVNEAKLTSLFSQQEVELERRPALPVGTPLIDLINVGIRDQTLAPSVLSALLEELGRQKTHPVLLAIDDFQALYCKSTYRDPHFSAIKSYHLSMPRLLLEYASGQKSFARGAVLGALSTSDTTFKVPLELREALNIPSDRPAGPYIKRSAELLEYTKGLQRLVVPDNLSIDEAASVFDVWMKDKAVPSTANDELFLAKYSEASGNARNFVWKGLLSSLCP
ncbi:mitochondrial ribosomal death-associated protein 3-domain-containing protein [Hygrophoropsis aurantiaca]|uniref:Mitochondrial ribosomal death-associated protein 3-domain-containing protein n=1 Tax=Hygrophoropsis aurantiaca TaxID=72124 RepID=A0ACB8AAU7_9AGAM|nr:mitochondrial ribosomal death-associated protein 3-domain-containing protein [Hygrophoropsis aurantiaca]